MTATNHAVMGAIVCATIANPVIGLPLAFFSHFVLDSLPHFGIHTVAKPTSKQYRAILRVDALLTVSFILIITFVGFKMGLPVWLLPLGAIFGWLPDVMWYKHYKNDLRGEPKQWDIIRSTHKKIQHLEVSWGWLVEVVWFISSVALLHCILFLS